MRAGPGLGGSYVKRKGREIAAFAWEGAVWGWLRWGRAALGLTYVKPIGRWAGCGTACVLGRFDG